VLPPEKIQAVDEPTFGGPSDARLPPREPVIAVEVRGDARAYPLRILMWHEVVNDKVGGIHVAVTYCPLCNTGVSFRRPRVQGDLLDFGVSGQLLHSNLVMIDRQTGTLWSQVTGEGLRGRLARMRLKLVPSQILAFRDWRKAHPDGKVLEPPTDLFVAPKVAKPPPYGANPYGGYDTTDAAPLFLGDPDPRLPVKTRVLGIAGRRDVVAVPYPELAGAAAAGRAVAELDVDGDPVVVFWRAGALSAVDASSIRESRNVGAAAAYSPVVAGESLSFEASARGFVDVQTGSRWDVLGRAVGGRLEGTRLAPVVAIDSFWFDWAAFYPKTKIYSAGE
jgi:hypothetical protein